MSRVGKLPVVIPEGVQAQVEAGVLKVTGSKGALQTNLHKDVLVSIEDNSIVVKPAHDEARAMWGTTRSIVNNLVHGVSKGFKRDLEIVGVGYRMALKDHFINLAVGKSHNVKVLIPEGIKVSMLKANSISIEGIDKEKVGQFVATIMKQKPVEPYKGKGIRFVGQVIKQKEGKKS